MATTQAMIGEVRLQLSGMLGQFAAVLPKHITAERFGRVVLTAIQNTPELLEADRRSLWNACMRAAQDGLLPDGRLGAVVLYKDRKRNVKLAQWLPMLQGIRQKVRNSGEIATWEAHCVHERDAYDYEEGDHPHIMHRPARGDRGPIIAAYSIAMFKTGEVSREWMWIEDLNKVRAVSKADRGPWQDWPEEMYRKTVAKRHAKVLPMSTDLDDLLRRPDEPEEDAEPAASALGMTEERQRLASMNDALDAIVATTAAKRKPRAVEVPVDQDDAGEADEPPQDDGEYAASDNDELPLEERHAGRG